MENVIIMNPDTYSKMTSSDVEKIKKESEEVNRMKELDEDNLRKEIDKVRSDIDALDNEMAEHGVTQNLKYRKSVLKERYKELLDRLELVMEMR